MSYNNQKICSLCNKLKDKSKFYRLKTEVSSCCSSCQDGCVDKQYLKHLKAIRDYEKIKEVRRMYRENGKIKEINEHQDR